MLRLNPEQTAMLRGWFLPERPGPLVGLHIIQTGHGVCFADRWPNPRALLANVAGNYSLAGNPKAVDRDALRKIVSGFVEAQDRFQPLLREVFPKLHRWDRVIYHLRGAVKARSHPGATVRRLGSGDAFHLWGLSPESSWISKTWGGPTGLAASGRAWGAFISGRLVSVACTLFYGLRHEELGAVTEPGFRRRGLGRVCVSALCEDVVNRGRRPGWSTSPDNADSIGVATRLGFELRRRDCLYVIGRPVPVVNTG